MSFLALVLAAKIVLTGFLTAVPFLFLPATRLATATGVTGGGETLFRLYGVAIVALLAGYASGFWILASGQFPWGVVIMGLVSNAGGAVLLLATGGWRKAVPITLVVSTIAVSLAIAALDPDFAMRPLW
ncbi:MAG: hypothetical protein R3C27_00260 [Hyphomonadaceae bacterium]